MLEEPNDCGEQRTSTVYDSNGCGAEVSPVRDSDVQDDGNTVEKWTPPKPECTHVSVVPEANHVVLMQSDRPVRPLDAPRPSHNAWFKEPAGVAKSSKRLSHGGVLRDRQSIAVGKSFLAPVEDEGEYKSKIASYRASLVKAAPQLGEDDMRRLI